MPNLNLDESSPRDRKIAALVQAMYVQGAVSVAKNIEEMPSLPKPIVMHGSRIVDEELVGLNIGPGEICKIPPAPPADIDYALLWESIFRQCVSAATWYVDHVSMFRKEYDGD